MPRKRRFNSPHILFVCYEIQHTTFIFKGILPNVLSYARPTYLLSSHRYYSSIIIRLEETCTAFNCDSAPSELLLHWQKYFPSSSRCFDPSHKRQQSELRPQVRTKQLTSWKRRLIRNQKGVQCARYLLWCLSDSSKPAQVLIKMSHK